MQGQALGQGTSDFHTLTLTTLATVNNPDLRGFDSSTITGPNDPFPDTSRPCCLNGSTMFGNGLGTGNSQASLNQNCGRLDFTSEHPPIFAGVDTPSCDPQTTSAVLHNELLFQTSRNGLLSRRSTTTTACNDLGTTADDRRCNEITFGFLQDIQEQGQVMDINFTIRSLTDADGNLVGAAQGTFTQSITENSVTSACSGSFTFDEQNGFVMTSGPLHEC